MLITPALLAPAPALAPLQWGSWDPVLFYLYVLLEANMNMGQGRRGVGSVESQRVG